MNRIIAVALIYCGWALTAAGTAQAQKKLPPPSRVEQMTGHNGKAPDKQPRFALPDGVKLEDGLSEDEAVAIALWNNATLHADLETLGLARADLVDAGLLRNPILSLILPVGPYRQFEGLLNFPLEVFWQRRRRVESSTIEVSRVAASLEQNALNLIRDVRVAYTDWLLARERARLAGEAVDVRGQIVRLTNVRLRVGDVSEVEATAARLDQSLSEEQATRFGREVAIMRDRLRQLLGTNGQSEVRSEPELKPELRPEVQAVTQTAQTIPAGMKVGRAEATTALEEMLKLAYESRPDLRSAALGIEAAAQRARWERSRVATLAGLLNIKQGEGVPFAPRPGALIELPVFNRNQGGVRRADAEVERASWQYLAVRQRITGEVEEAYHQHQQARETLAIWEAQTLPLAEENVRLARSSFNQGDQSYLFVLEAVRRLVEVRQREAELRADVRRSAAQLERSTGQNPERSFNAKR